MWIRPAVYARSPYCLKMLLVLWFAAFTVFSHASYAQAKIGTAEHTLLDPPFELETSIGRLSVTQEGDTLAPTFHVSLNNSSLFTSDTGVSLSVIVEVPESKPSILVFMIETGGTGCPAVYRILDVASKPKPFLSDEIGNCSEGPTFRWKVDHLDISFPHIGGAHSQRWVYAPSIQERAAKLKKLQ